MRQRVGTDRFDMTIERISFGNSSGRSVGMFCFLGFSKAIQTMMLNWLKGFNQSSGFDLLGIDNGNARAFSRWFSPSGKAHRHYAALDLSLTLLRTELRCLSGGVLSVPM